MVGLLAINNQPTEYIAIAHCRHSFHNMPSAWRAFFGWPISCITWAAGASPGAATRDGVGLMLTSKSRLGQATEAINDHLRCNDAEAHGQNNRNRRHGVGEGCTQEVEVRIRVVSELHKSAGHSEQEDTGHHRYYRGKANGGEWHPPATRDWSQNSPDQQTGDQSAGRWSGAGLQSPPSHGM